MAGNYGTRSEQIVKAGQQGGTKHIGAERGAVDTSAETYGTTAGKGLTTKTGFKPSRKMESNEDPRVYGQMVAAERAEYESKLESSRQNPAGGAKNMPYDTTPGRKKAVKGMLTEKVAGE